MLFEPNLEPVFVQTFNRSVQLWVALVTASPVELVRQRHGHEEMRLVAENACPVSLAGCIVGKHYVSGLKNFTDAVACFNLP